MTGVLSSQVHFNVKVYFGSQKMQFRHPNLDILVSPRHRFYCIGNIDWYEVPPVIFVLVTLTHWSTWSTLPRMTYFIS